MKESRFAPPKGAFTRTVPIRFSHCDPAGIVYFPHYFDMFNGLIEDWYTEQLDVNYAKLILGSHRNRFQTAESHGRAAGSDTFARARRAIFVECHHYWPYCGR
jgi:hypothetical protein